MKPLNLPTRNPRKKAPVAEVPSNTNNWTPLRIDKYPHLKTRGTGYETMLQTKVKMVQEYIER